MGGGVGHGGSVIRLRSRAVRGGVHGRHDSDPVAGGRWARSSFFEGLMEAFDIAAGGRVVRGGSASARPVGGRVRLEGVAAAFAA